VGSSERRKEPREALAGRSLWVVAPDGSLGAVAWLRNASLNGLSIAVNRRAAHRLVAALEDARKSGRLVELANVPSEGYRQARVVWSRIAEDPDHAHFGLEVTEPLGRLMAELRSPARSGSRD
jgi:hypothetical protein